jgi:hypothetical protein
MVSDKNITRIINENKSNLSKGLLELAAYFSTKFFPLSVTLPEDMNPSNYVQDGIFKLNVLLSTNYVQDRGVVQIYDSNGNTLSPQISSQRVSSIVTTLYDDAIANLESYFQKNGFRVSTVGKINIENDKKGSFRVKQILSVSFRSGLQDMLASKSYKASVWSLDILHGEQGVVKEANIEDFVSSFFTYLDDSESDVIGDDDYTVHSSGLEIYAIHFLEAVAVADSNFNLGYPFDRALNFYGSASSIEEFLEEWADSDDSVITAMVACVKSKMTLKEAKEILVNDYQVADNYIEIFEEAWSD